MLQLEEMSRVENVGMLTSKSKGIDRMQWIGGNAFNILTKTNIKTSEANLIHFIGFV